MHNVRKIKRKKKIKPEITEDPSPQETLIEISNNQEQETNFNELDMFLQSLKRQSKESTLSTLRKNLQRRQSFKVKTHSSQPMNLSNKTERQKNLFNFQGFNFNKQSQFKSSSARFIYLKKYDTSQYLQESNTKRYSRSKTVFSSDESNKIKANFEETSRRTTDRKPLRIKRPSSVDSEKGAFTSPFIVKNMKLFSRYPPSHLQ